MSKDSNTVFLDVDLDVQTPDGLDALLGSLSANVVVLYRDTTKATVELASEAASLEKAILGLLSLIEELPADVRKVWDQASKRSMNIGIQAGTTAFHRICYSEGMHCQAHQWRS
jgi:hypothetical protein